MAAINITFRSCLIVLTVTYHRASLQVSPYSRMLHFKTLQVCSRRSQWPRGLRHGSATARLLGFSGSNPAGCLNFSLVFVVGCQVEGSATGRSLVQWSPADCVCVIKCDKAQQ